MNYNKIYTSLIERARGRSDRDGVYHKHHIIPIHEDGNSTETVLLTVKEHAIRVEMNRVNSVLGGKRSKELGTNFSSMSAEEQLKIASLGGAATAKKYTGTKVWNNGVRNCRAFESPGPEWTLGMINVKKDKL